MKKGFFILLAIFLLLSLVACQKEEPVVAPPVENEEIVVDEKEEEPKEQETVFPFHAPLTGLGSMVELNERTIAVMINNHGKARPQSGLDQADIVYEVLAEGGITRLVAFYQSQSPEVIGPVRSLRPYLIDLATGYDAVFAHAGGSQEALDIAKKRGLPHLDEIYNAGSSFYRVKFRKAPHNLYTNLDLLRKGAERRKYNEEGKLPILSFKDPQEEMTGAEAGWIDIKYYDSYAVSYEYDPETGMYSRYVKGEPHVDMETSKQLTMTNLLVIETRHKTLDSVGRRAIDLMSEGKGYLFQKGKVIEVDWKRVDGVIRPFKDGEEVGLYPGTTWVNIIPDRLGLKENVTYKITKN
jgi:predicted small lipoprotein YifL